MARELILVEDNVSAASLTLRSLGIPDEIRLQIMEDSTSFQACAHVLKYNDVEIVILPTYTIAQEYFQTLVNRTGDDFDIIMDYELPGGNGGQLITFIRQLGLAKNVARIYGNSSTAENFKSWLDAGDLEDNFIKNITIDKIKKLKEKLFPEMLREIDETHSEKVFGQEDTEKQQGSLPHSQSTLELSKRFLPRSWSGFFSTEKTPAEEVTNTDENQAIKRSDSVLSFTSVSSAVSTVSGTFSNFFNRLMSSSPQPPNQETTSRTSTPVNTSDKGPESRSGTPISSNQETNRRSSTPVLFPENNNVTDSIPAPTSSTNRNDKRRNSADLQRGPKHGPKKARTKTKDPVEKNTVENKTASTSFTG